MAKNAFASAPKVTKSVAKSAAPTVALPGLEKYAAIVAVEKAVKALKSRYEATVKAAGFDVFVTEGAKTGAAPENFKSKEGMSESSVQLKKRTPLSAFSAEEIALCEANNIPLTIKTGALKLNPKYAEDAAKMKEYGEKIGKLNLPDDLFVKEEDVVVASDEAIAAVFATKKPSLINMLLPIQTTVAFRTSTGLSVEEAFTLVKSDLAVE